TVFSVAFLYIYWYDSRSGSVASELWMGQEAWRRMFMAEAVPAIVYGVMALRLPESPRFLVARGKVDKASQVLLDFTGETDVNLKIEQIRKTLQAEKRESLADLPGHSSEERRVARSGRTRWPGAQTKKTTDAWQ